MFVISSMLKIFVWTFRGEVGMCLICCIISFLKGKTMQCFKETGYILNYFET